MNDMKRVDAVHNFIAQTSPQRGELLFDRFLSEDTIQLNQQQVISYEEGEIWEPHQLRGVGRKAHGWFFVLPWATAFLRMDDEKRARLVSAFEDLLRRWSEKSKMSGSMAFHDETTAQRAMNISYALSIFEKSVGAEARNLGREIVAQDVKLLESDDFYAGRNNHGMFQDMGILFAVAHGHAPNRSEELEVLALSRLAEYFAEAFTEEGIHSENNPYYHLVISRHLKSVLSYAEIVGKSGLFRDIQRIFKDADKYAAFALTPAGSFPPISDTIVRPISKTSAISAFGEGYLLGAVTAGQEGKLPEGKVFVAEASGYGIFRDGWTNPDDTFIFFSSAYNANYHKHSDELSVFIHANQHDLVSEAGPYGYDYGHPFTKHGYSSFAHNTLVVGDRGLPRVDRDKAHLTTLHDNGSTSKYLDVIGRTQRYEGVDWRRRVLSGDPSKGEPIRIRDAVDSDEDHNYKFLWHFGPKVIAQINGSVTELFSTETGDKIGEFGWFGSQVTSVKKFRGQTEPSVMGWHFPKLGSAEECDCLQVEFKGRSVQVEWRVNTDNFVFPSPNQIAKA